MAGGDPSSHGRAGPGPRLLLGTRCPLPNPVLGCGALDHCLQPGQWLSPGVGWQGPHGFAHAGHTRPGTCGPRATAAVGRQHSHLGPKKTPTRQMGGNPGMDLQGRNRPAPLLAHPTPCLAPGAFSVPNRALGVPFPTVPGTSAKAETPQNTPVPFCQAMARAGTSRAGFLRRLQGLTTLGLLFKFLVFI